jgi:hypothetical protein
VIYLAAFTVIWTLFMLAAAFAIGRSVGMTHGVQISTRYLRAVIDEMDNRL